MWDRSVGLERLSVAVALLLIGWGIGSFGIWDPWELGVAEAARMLDQPISATSAAIAAAFEAFGVREWSGRLPGVVAAGLSCMLAFALVRRFHGPAAAVIAVAVLVSTPMFLLDARLMMGASLAVFAQTWTGAAALHTFFSAQRGARLVATYLLLAFGILASTLTSGVLLGPLPPLLAIGAWALLSEDRGRTNRVGRWLFPTVAAILTVGVVHAVRLDDPDYSVWLGGGAVGGNPPTFDEAVELVFHGFAPWSAALPIAAIAAIAPSRLRDGRTQGAASVLLLWAAFGLASWTLFASRYGTPSYLAQVPLAALVAFWLADVVREQRARWPAAVIVALLGGLLVRDYILYPDSPLRSLAADGLSIPEVYDASRQWAALFSTAALLLGLTLISHDTLERPDTAGAVRWARARWDAGWVERGWLILGLLLMAALLFYGAACFTLDLPIASVAIRVGRVLFFVPLILALLVIGLPWLRWTYGRLGRLRAFPALAGGLAVGAFVALSFQPALSQHFSPKPVYQAYLELTEGRNEPLGSYELPSTAARYYTDTDVTLIDERAMLFAFLREGGQRWAVIEADELATLDRAYRRETGTHLYVADAKNARLLLVSAKPLEGRPNQSFVAKAVLPEAPKPEHPVRASFEDRIELVGYDLRLPGVDSVGAGQRFEITWYWRVLAEAPTGQQVFVHIDGFGLRLNGDHVPVRGKYPTNLWLEGDVIVDTQTLTVPANYRNGDYTIYVGLYRGNKRLTVKSGPSDDANRVDAGVLQVR